MTTDDRPTTDDLPQGQFTHFGKISNGHNSATRHPIPFMFGSGVWFSGTADRTAPFPVGSNSRWRPAAILENFKRPYLSDASSDSLHVCMQTILCPRSLIYNNGNSKHFITQGQSGQPTVYREKTKKQILRNSGENNARGVHIRLVTRQRSRGRRGRTSSPFNGSSSTEKRRIIGRKRYQVAHAIHVTCGRSSSN